MALSSRNAVPASIEVGMRIGRVLSLLVGRTLKEYQVHGGSALVFKADASWSVASAVEPIPADQCHMAG